MERGMHFDTVTELYKSSRPGCSSLLIDDLLRLSRIQSGGSVLDVGGRRGSAGDEGLAKGNDSPVAGRVYRLEGHPLLRHSSVFCRRIRESDEYMVRSRWIER